MVDAPKNDEEARQRLEEAKQMSVTALKIKNAALERQIAELRAKLKTTTDSRGFWKKAAEEEYAKLNALAAENARLRALPLKDEVERPDFWAVQSKTGMHIGLWTDRADADEAMHEYEGGTIMPLFRSSLLSRLRAGEQEGRRASAVCDVLTMRHSSGFPDHFTRIICGDRFLTTYMSKIKGRCEYHAAEFDWLLNGTDKPNILAFDYSEPEGLADYLKSTAAPDLLDKLAEHTNLELSWGAHPDDDTEACWQVHCVNGGRNDREWTLVGVGNTPREALYAAFPAAPSEQGGDRP